MSKKIKISKELFIETINKIKEQIDHDDKCWEAFKIILPNDFVTGYDNNIVIGQLIKILKVATKDDHKDSWIEYFIYELHFGKKYAEGCATYKNGENIDLSTPEDLYEFLVKEVESKN
jgi:hypothetical protein